MVENLQKQIVQGQSTVDQLINDINNEKMRREPSVRKIK